MSTASAARATEPADAARAATVDRNLDLVHGYMQAMLADPSRMEVVPDGVSTILLPRDDAEAFEANLAMAATLARGGASVYLRHVERDGRPVPLPPAPPEPPEEA